MINSEAMKHLNGFNKFWKDKVIKHLNSLLILKRWSARMDLTNVETIKWSNIYILDSETMKRQNGFNKFWRDKVIKHLNSWLILKRWSARMDLTNFERIKWWNIQFLDSETMRDSYLCLCLSSYLINTNVQMDMDVTRFGHVLQKKRHCWLILRMSSLWNDYLPSK